MPSGCIYSCNAFPKARRGRPGSPTARSQTWIKFRLVGGGEQRRRMKIYSCRDKSKQQKQYPPGCAVLPPKKKTCGNGTGWGWLQWLQLPAIAAVLCSSLCPAWPCFGTGTVLAPSGPSPCRCGSECRYCEPRGRLAHAWKGPRLPRFSGEL